MQFVFQRFIQFMVKKNCGREGKTKPALTSREACPLVAASELNVEVSYQRMNVVIPFHLQAER